MTKQSCRTCRFLDVEPDSAGRRIPRRGFIYDCTAPEPAWPLMPDSITTYYGFRLPSQRRRMEPTDGTTCPIWAPIEKVKP